MVEAFRPRQQAEIQGNTEVELPEAKIFDLLSSVGSGEHHGLALMVMKKGVAYSRHSHYKELMNHQRKGGEWRISNKLPFAHCEDSLLPAHLVTRKAISFPGGAKWAHQITEYGLDTGVSFGGVLLKWSSEHPNHSLYKMSGTGRLLSVSDDEFTQETRSTQKTRYIILRQISESTDKIRQRDILYATDEESG